jgi:tRNA(Ile)-lysidine synthase
MSKFALSPVTKAFLNQNKIYLPDFSGKVVAGISGGPDSMALMYLLHRRQIETVAVHVNYRLRGEASDRDQELVEQIAATWNLECVSVRLDPDEGDGNNFQAWARDRRYEIFRDLKRECNARYILTAHHEDDQLETILQKIMRGAGLPAWKGMDVLDGDLYRPLLGVSKSEILAFIQEFNIPYRIDRTNEESTYARNFIRNNWFPELNRLFPGWKSNLLRIPDRSDEFLRMADLIFEYTRHEPDGLHRQKFLDLPREIQPVVFQRFAEQSGFLNLQVSRGFLKSTGRLKTLQTGQVLQLSDDVEVIRDRGSFKLIERKTALPKTVTLSKEQLEEGQELFHFKIEIAAPPEQFPGNRLYLDVQSLTFPLALRHWKAGDSFQPFGMTGNQLVSDHLANRKISSALKKQAKVLESFDGTICAVIFPHHSGTEQPGTISERVRCSPETKQTVTIRKTEKEE